MAKTRTTTIELDDAARAAIDVYCEKGKKKGYVMSRLIEWFTQQETSVQALIMGDLSQEDAPAIVASMLKRFAEGRAPPKSERRARA